MELDQRAERNPEPIRVQDVFEGDVVLDGEGGELRCTDEAVHFRKAGDGLRVPRRDDDSRIPRRDDDLWIPRQDVVNVRVDTDESVTGFDRIGNGFAVVSLLMTGVFVQTLLTPASIVSVPGLGSLFAAPLAAYGAVWMRRLDGGERRVLQIDCADGSRTEFVTREADGAFERIHARLTAERP